MTPLPDNLPRPPVTPTKVPRRLSSLTIHRLHHPELTLSQLSSQNRCHGSSSQGPFPETPKTFSFTTAYLPVCACPSNDSPPPPSTIPCPCSYVQGDLGEFSPVTHRYVCGAPRSHPVAEDMEFRAKEDLWTLGQPG